MSLSFQNIGGLDEDKTCSIFLFFSKSIFKLFNLLSLFKKVLKIKIFSSKFRLFSFNILIVFFFIFG